MDYVIYTDESASDGPYYANFYGGVLIEAARLEEVESTLAAAKASAGIGAEAKWSRVSLAYLERYENHRIDPSRKKP